MDEQLHFASFRLDLANEWLWRGTELLPLRPRSWAVLRYLVEHPNRLVPQVEILQALWPHPYLSDGLLRGYIRELRRVLGDEVKSPRFIQTANGRGYRFIAPVTRSPSFGLPAGTGTAVALAPRSPFVGREDELQRLNLCLDAALQGQRQLVLVGGEPGIGKTALVERFVALAAARRPLWFGRGQCVEQHGAGEPYLPLLEALTRLARAGGTQRVVAALRRYAPSWLLHLPSLIEPAERAGLQAMAGAASQDRVARELVEAVEALAAEQPLLLWLDDLHWSDPSTLDLLGMLARRIEPTSVLVVGTFRPAETSIPGHPLRPLMQELGSHGLCAEVVLHGLDEEDVGRYLERRVPWLADEASSHRLHRRTDGIPLFLVALVDELSARRAPDGGPAAAWALDDVQALPDSLRHLLERQVERLDLQAQQLLGVASVVGMEFPAALVAAVQGVEPASVEARCEQLLAAKLFLSATPSPAAPERRAAARYRFRHALYRELLRQRLPLSVRRELHLRIGQWQAATYGERGALIAAELAGHFEQGGDVQRAIGYRQQAAQQSLLHAANREAIDHLQHALRLIGSVAATEERDRSELSLQAMLTAPLLMTQGYTAAATKQAFARAFTLAQRVGTSPQLFPVVLGLFRLALFGGELDRAGRLAGQLLSIANAEPARARRPTACLADGAVLFHRGELGAALSRFDECLRSGGARTQVQRTQEYGEDDTTIACVYAAWLLTLLGLEQRARRCLDDLLARAESLSHPFNTMQAHAGLSYHALLSRDARAALRHADISLELCRRHGLPRLWTATVTLHRGWALAVQGDAARQLPEMRDALETFTMAGALQWLSFTRMFMAEACFHAGRVQEALSLLDDALAHAQRIGEHCFSAEIHRLRGEWQLREAEDLPPDTAARCERDFMEAIALARQQQARLFELRAAASLVRLQRRQQRAGDAERSLAALCEELAQHGESDDLARARQLLDDPSAP